MDTCYDALGFRFTVASSEPAVRRQLSDLLSGLATTPGPADAGLELDDESLTTATAIAALVGNINLRAAGAAAGSLLVHAGAVCTTEGLTAVLCGPSGSGKSTLTAALVRRGYAYVTDETVCLDPASLRIAPFRKPLALKSGSHGVLGHLRPTTPGLGQDGREGAEAWLVSPTALGGPPLPTGPLLPEVVVFPTFRAGSAATLEPVSPAEAAYALGINSARLWEVRGGGLAALARVARRAPAYRLVYDDVHAAAGLVADRWAA